MEVFILGLCIGGIVMFFYRLFIGQELEDKIHKEPNKYHNFHHVIIWDEVGRIVSAVRTIFTAPRFTYAQFVSLIVLPS